MSVSINHSVYFGFQNEKGLEVSAELKARGLDYLRASPSQLNLFALRDFVQIGYDVYKGLLPAYMTSMYTQSAVSLATRGFDFTFPAKLVYPFKTPPVLINFAHPIDEVVLSIREKDGWEVSDHKSGKAEGLLIDGYKWTQLGDIMQYKPSLITPVNNEMVNPSTLVICLFLNKVATSFSAMQFYAGASDPEHYANLTEIYSQNGWTMENTSKDMVVDEDEADVTTFRTIFGQKVKMPGYKPGISIKYKGPFNPRNAQPCDPTTLLDALPNINGLFMPYLTILANYDDTTVTDIIRTYFITALGETHEQIVEVFAKVKSEWGVIHKTEFGKQMTHYYTCIRLAIEGQAFVTPIFERGVYKGAVIQGAGFTVVRNESNFRPGSRATLINEIRSVGSNLSILARIAAKARVTDKDDIEKLAKVESMGALRGFIVDYVLDNEERNAVVSYAKGLSFHENSWGINAETITKAAQIISDVTEDLDVLPIHHTMLFETKRAHVVWSAFGYMAPTFRVPSGTKIALEKNYAGAPKKMPKGEIRMEGAVTRVACNNVILKKALSDLDDMMAQKEILNPLAKGSVPKSAFSQMRSFAGKDFQTVMTALRKMSGATLQESSKRKRDIDDEGEGSGARRGPLSYD